MPIELTEAGFSEWRHHRPGEPGLAADSLRLCECVAHFHSARMRGWIGSPGLGFAERNLDFLRETPDASWLWFWDVELDDVSGLYTLPRLKEFGINPKRPGIDFGRLPPLDIVVNHWNQADQGLTECRIEKYDLWHYKPRSKSFAELSLPVASRLRLYWCNPETLDHLPALPRLKALEIHRCRNLRDLTALPRVAPNLKSLLVTSSGRCLPDAGIQSHPTLKYAVFNGKNVLAGR